MHDEETIQKARESLAQRKPNGAIAIAADLANDDLNSICRISLAWISNGSVHGLSYMVKPPGHDFTARTVTADMVADSLSFADTWEQYLRPLLDNQVLAAYRSEQLFLAIKASYEASCSESFTIQDLYIRDLKFLASTYIADLGNDSFISIMHYMKISVDLDNSLSRAMGCACGIDWLERLYPVSSYGIPLSAIMAGALRQPDPESELQRHEEDSRKYKKLQYYTKILFMPFLILCILLTAYYLHRYEETQKTQVDFANYSPTEVPRPEESPGPAGIADAEGHYLMLRGTYVIPDKETIPEFLHAVQNQEMEKIRAMVRENKVIVFANPVRIKEEGHEEGRFIAVKILEGEYAGVTGYAPREMITR
ncbi:hypothetical protein [uncultured Megasphaera sp.]|uniref:hypothetical protein n=1 Tax=uncultured Megasphaera sp. TaxID=165188 RepID=UPI00265B1C90|nr:hypothetical protein [uncultured Megasphaera sp.]